MFRNADDYYPQDKAYRAQEMRIVERERLAHEARSSRIPDFSIASEVQSHSRFVLAVLLAILFILLSLMSPYVTHAQSRADPGQGEFFTDAMVAYRVGYYYFLKGDYDRAVEEYSDVIDGIPERVFETCVDYALIYWDLGDAQLMSRQYDEALISYQHFLDLAGDQASDLAVAYVQKLQAALNNGTADTVGLISG